VRFFGEIAVRGELIRHESFGDGDDATQLRERFRLRAGLDARLTETLYAGARLSTGDPALPTGALSSFSNDFRRHPINVDRAFVGFRPMKALDIHAGMAANPLFTPSDLVWDVDAQPAGLFETLELGKSGLTLAAGQLVLREVRSLRPDNEAGSFLLAEGLSYRRESEGVKATIGVSHYFYTDPDVVALALRTGDLSPILRTNRFDPNGRTIPNPAKPGERIPVDFFSGFSILQAGLRLDHAVSPFGVTAEGAMNLAARRDPSLGPAYAARAGFAWLLTVRYGRIARPWQVLGSIGYAHIPSDAVLAAFSSDDLQQTNVRCVPVDLRMRLPGERSSCGTPTCRRSSTPLPRPTGASFPRATRPAYARGSPSS
jgi:hypothetical protein